MGSQSQAPQHAQARTMVNQNQNNTSNNNNALMGSGGIGRFNSLARQTSIYSLTLDEFQNTITESGKNFGSMNMDEFLKNIWTAEESQAMASAMAGAGGGSGGSSGEGNAVGNGGGLARQTSLARQPSLSLPRTLSRKTVDEVWRDIHGGSSGEDGDASGSSGDAKQHQRQTTFGEMTLEDFLVKAGVVRDEGEQGTPPYGSFSPYVGNSNGTNGASERGSDRGETMGPGSVAPTLSLSPANALTSTTPLDTISPMDAYKHGQAQQQAQQQAHQADWFRNIQQQQHMLQAHAQAEAAAAAYGNAMSKRVGNGGIVPTMAPNGGYAGMASALAPGLGQMTVTGGLGMGLGGGPMSLALAPGSPVSPPSDEVGHSHGSALRLSPAGNYGLDGSMRGRKRGADGPVEKVVERRQRRMIKNRESAARSRARKQAYTVELEAEVTQLKEENSRFRKQQEEESLRLKKMVLDSIKKSGGDDRKRSLRRTKTGPW